MSLTEETPLKFPGFEPALGSGPSPWDVADSWYEQRKLAVLLAALPLYRYRAGWEPGCGPGSVSTALAGRVDRLVASDSSDVAVQRARRRCAGLRNVTVVLSEVPEIPVTTPVSLIVAADLLCYVPDLRAALEAMWWAAEPGSHIAFMHLAHRPDGGHRSGRDVHAQIAIDAIDQEAVRVVSHADADFMLDIYQATG